MGDIDWSEHTPHEVRLALESAPKVAGPWTQRVTEGRPKLADWRRRGVDLHGWVGGDVAEAWYYGDEPGAKPTCDTVGARLETCASIEDAKAKADVALRAAGWLLDDDSGA